MAEKFPKPKRELSPEEIIDAQAGLHRWDKEIQAHEHDLEKGLWQWDREVLKEERDTDPLTRLRRPEALNKELDRLLKLLRGEVEQKREGNGTPKEISVIFIDLDNFKEVNTKLGHLGGNQVLRRVADVLQDPLRRGTDMLARYGGDEFVVLMPNATEEYALKTAEALLKAFDDDEELKKLNVTASFGVCSSEVSSATDSMTFVHHADIAAYQAKEGGKNRVVAYTPGLEQTHEHLRTAGE